jgi:hypothetical protein
MVAHHLQLSSAATKVSGVKVFLVKMLFLSDQHLKLMVSVVMVLLLANSLKTLFEVDSH